MEKQNLEQQLIEVKREINYAQFSSQSEFSSLLIKREHIIEKLKTFEKKVEYDVDMALFSMLDYTHA
ncbi:hypothetical protein [Sphingobacterium kyonggiense]